MFLNKICEEGKLKQEVSHKIIEYIFKGVLEN